MTVREWQFDGLIGPTHNYAGLSFGNVASSGNAGLVSNPRKAALQGLEKMRFVRDLGMRQAFIPPHYRPIIPELERMGFTGGINYLLQEATRVAPAVLASVYSSSFMWAANAATIAPSSDAADGKLHVTPANLLTNYHRSLEPTFTTQLLRRIFANERHFCVHSPLASTTRLGDEGAANHMRVSVQGHGNSGLHIFVYGVGADSEPRPVRFPARQTREAYEAIARLHGIAQDCQFFVQQLPEAIDAGVFHNDVICMNTTRLMVAHEKAFLCQPEFTQRLSRATEGMDWNYIEISDRELPLADAVASYFFNAQMLELPDGRIMIVAPTECEENPRARDALARLQHGNDVAAVHYRDVRESMRNGGGPACLRLRVVLTDEEAASMHQGIVLNDETYAQLVAWVNRHYRDRLSFEDLRDPALIVELQDAYAALEPIIGLPGLYTSQF